MGSRAHLARQQGDIDTAVRLFEEALRLFREVGDPRGIANSLANLGHAMLTLHQPAHSSRCFAEALALRRSLGNTLGIAECLEGFAAVAASTHHARRAARLLGAASALRQITGAPLPASERKQYEQVLDRVKQQLSPDRLEREQSAGRALNADQAADYGLMVADVRDGESPDAIEPGDTILSEREREVAALVARGMTNREIAHLLLVSPRTVGTHLEHIFAKLGVQARAEVAVWISHQGRGATFLEVRHTGRADH
jgi:non-specific serine/threonine protein kinase